MSGSKAAYQRARRAAIKAGTWNPRGGGGQKKEAQAVNMSIIDQRTIASLQSDIDDERRSLPSFIKEGMTREQIESAIIKELQKKEYEIKDNTSDFFSDGIKTMNIASTSISRLDLDGRFSAPRDSKFEPLIRALNRDITLKELEDMAPKGPRIHTVDYSLHRIVEQVCSRYTTKELTQFINQELHRPNTGLIRDEKITIIQLAVQTRHAPATRQNGWRDSLSERTRKWDSVVGSLKKSFDRIKISEEQIQAIRDKYNSNGTQTQSKQTSAVSRQIARRQAQREAEIRMRVEAAEERKRELKARYGSN